MRKFLFTLLIAFLLVVSSIAQTYQNEIIYTPNGTSIIARKLISGDMTTALKNDRKNYYLSYYNNRITFISEATYSYNCHAYTWHVSEGGNNVWINTPGDDTYWEDGSYCLSTAFLGTKVSYASDDHSAITTSEPGILQSKWGAAGGGT